ncbi:amino acid ABC transporter substrate-binding protein [Xenophilus arseniciresistens]|uniref:Amino acid ABC transporter substrate-binding protein n=1 Tax=Xenophilus arseniciresistens TaxID=1283306 RepID=A0AAE3SZG9_9BURK|nr:amino acid ABC transporter substrate-binding protein [Xenophilus arseniciresistens]MDA7417094.1 amino acid ABC transporter substrate-binding protein [Xenophilus arseniciresistens]
MTSSSLLYRSVAMLALLVATTTAAQAQAILKRIDERGQINVGHRDSSVPFSYYDENKQVVGYTVDLCMKIVEEVKKKLGKDLKVNFVPITTANRIPQVTSGAVDMECGTTTITLGRMEQVDFSMPFWVTGTQLAVQKKERIQQAEDLKGKTVGVLQASTNERALQKLSQDKGLNLKFNYIKDYAEGFLSLETGRIDALAGDGTPMAVFAATRARKPADLAVVGRLLTTDPYGIMMQRGDADFRLLVNRALAKAFESGEAQKLLAKHFGPTGVKPTPELLNLYQSQSIPD